MCSSLRLKPSSLRQPQRSLAAALQEDWGNLFFTTSVENRESPLYIRHYPGSRTGAPTREARGYPLRAWENEGRVDYLLLLLILTTLPLDCVAPTGGYVGDLQEQDTGYLTRFSANSEYSSNTSSEATQSLTNVLRVDSNGGVLVKPRRRFSWLFF